MLEHPETELRHDRQDVIEDIRLDPLVLRPFRRRREAIDLDRQSVGGRIALPDQEGHVLPDLGMGLQIVEHVGPERTDVGEPSRVDRIFPRFLYGTVRLREQRLFPGEILAEHVEPLEVLDLVFPQEADRGLVHVQIAPDPAPARLGHEAPVPKPVAAERMGGNRGDRLVPVLDFHRVESDFDDVSVSTEFRHLDPVADPDHVVGGDLYAGHHRENRVLENQHEDRGHGPEAAQQHQR